MRKEMKPGRNYMLINIDEPYAEAVFEILKVGQTAKGLWPEGDIGFLEWKDRTFHFDIQEHPLVGVTDVICKACGKNLLRGEALTPHRLRECIKPLSREARRARERLRENILNAVVNLVRKFLIYDREVDVDLPIGVVERAISEGTISVDEIVEKFWVQLKTQL